LSVGSTDTIKGLSPTQTAGARGLRRLNRPYAVLRVVAVLYLLYFAPITPDVRTERCKPIEIQVPKLEPRADQRP
jgi:hypothetical protein